MKRSKQCPKCGSLRIGHIEVQPDMSGDIPRPGPRPAGHTFKEVWLEGKRPHGVGVLEAYVCTECGYYESYVVDPQKVPWGQLGGFRMVNPEPEPGGPYR
jgi:hypothetical protein